MRGFDGGFYVLVNLAGVGGKVVRVTGQTGLLRKWFKVQGGTCQPSVYPAGPILHAEAIDKRAKPCQHARAAIHESLDVMEKAIEEAFGKGWHRMLRFCNQEAQLFRNPTQRLG